YLAEVLFPRDWTPGQLVQVDGAREGESLRVRAPACATIDRFYENQTRYPGSQLLTKAAALQQLGRGHGIVQHVGHGSRSQISVGSELITLADVASPAFGDSAFFWVSSNCASAAVDFDCFAEALLRKPGGAVAYVGATRDAWPGVSEVVAEARHPTIRRSSFWLRLRRNRLKPPAQVCCPKSRRLTNCRLPKPLLTASAQPESRRR
ncbi:MAG: C25 family cysteine peptidase, partial [Acidobacteriota bacterium]